MASLRKELKEKVKGKETWITHYEGHEIRIVNKLKLTMYIDSVEAAKQKGIISNAVTLTADIPNTDKTVIAYIHSNDTILDGTIKCDILIGKKCEYEYGFEHKNGSFVALTKEEEAEYRQYRKEDAENTDATAAVLSNL